MLETGYNIAVWNQWAFEEAKLNFLEAYQAQVTAHIELHAMNKINGASHSNCAVPASVTGSVPATTTSHNIASVPALASARAPTGTTSDEATSASVMLTDAINEQPAAFATAFECIAENLSIERDVYLQDPAIVMLAGEIALILHMVYFLTEVCCSYVCGQDAKR